MEDVVTDYKWTTTQGSYKTEAPRIYVTSYAVTSNAIAKAVKTYYTLVKESFGQAGELLPGSSIGNGIEYYNNMHTVESGSQERYVLPFFGDDVRSLNNAWGDSFVGSTNGSNTGFTYGESLKTLAETGTNLINQVNAMAADKPGALFEPPKFYQYSQDEGPVTVSFMLINTDEDGDASKNYKLIKKLITENRFKRDDSNSFIVTPPRLWSVIVPGYRAIRWASCSVSVNLLGTRRYIDLAGDGNILVPEGYNVTLTFTPLYTEPSNFASVYNSTGFN